MLSLNTHFDYTGSKILIESAIKSGVKDTKTLETLKKAASAFDYLFYATDSNLKEILRATLAETLTFYISAYQKHSDYQLRRQIKFIEPITKKFGSIPFANLQIRTQQLSESGNIPILQAIDSITDVILYFLIMRSVAYTNKLAFMVDAIGFFAQLGSLILIILSSKIHSKTQALVTGITLGLMVLPVLIVFMLYMIKRYKKGDLVKRKIKDEETGEEIVQYTPTKTTSIEKLAEKRLAIFHLVKTIKTLALLFITILKGSVITNLLKLLPEPVLKVIYNGMKNVMLPVSPDVQKKVQSMLQSGTIQHAAYLYAGQLIGIFVVFIVSLGIASYIKQRYGISIFDKLATTLPAALVATAIEIAMAILGISLTFDVQFQIDTAKIVKDKGLLESNTRLNQKRYYLQEAENMFESAKRLLKRSADKLNKIFAAFITQLKRAIKQSLTTLKNDRLGTFRTAVLANFVSMVNLKASSDTEINAITIQFENIKQYIETTAKETTLVISTPLSKESIFMSIDDLTDLFKEKFKGKRATESEIRHALYALIFATTYKRFLEAFNLKPDSFKPKFFLTRKNGPNAFCFAGRVALVGYEEPIFLSMPIVYIAGIIAHELGHCYFQFRNLGYAFLRIFGLLYPSMLVDTLARTFNLPGFYPILTMSMFELVVSLILQSESRFFEIEADAASHIAIGGAVEGLLYFVKLVGEEHSTFKGVLKRTTVKKESDLDLKDIAEKVREGEDLPLPPFGNTEGVKVEAGYMQTTELGKYIGELEGHGPSTARINAIVGMLAKDENAAQKAKERLKRSAQVWKKLMQTINNADDITEIVHNYIRSKNILF